MRTSIDLLDWFQTRISGGSDYMVHKVTGISKTTISTIRNGKGEFSDNNILLMLVVGEHPEPLKTLAKIVAYKAEKQGDDKMAKIWNDSAA